MGTKECSTTEIALGRTFRPFREHFGMMLLEEETIHAPKDAALVVLDYDCVGPQRLANADSSSPDWRTIDFSVLC